MAISVVLRTSTFNRNDYELNTSAGETSADFINNTNLYNYSSNLILDNEYSNSTSNLGTSFSRYYDRYKGKQLYIPLSYSATGTDIGKKIHVKLEVKYVYSQLIREWEDGEKSDTTEIKTLAFEFDENITLESITRTKKIYVGTVSNPDTWTDSENYTQSSVTTQSATIKYKIETKPCEDQRTSLDTHELIITFFGGKLGIDESTNFHALIQPDGSNNQHEITLDGFSYGNFMTSINRIAVRFTSGNVRGEGTFTVYGRVSVTLYTPDGMDIENYDDEILFVGQFTPCCDYPFMFTQEFNINDYKSSGWQGDWQVVTVTATKIKWSGFNKLEAYCCDKIQCDDNQEFGFEFIQEKGGIEEVDISCICNALQTINNDIRNGNLALVSAITQLELKPNINVQSPNVNVAAPNVNVEPNINVSPTPVTVEPCNPLISVSPTPVTVTPTINLGGDSIESLESLPVIAGAVETLPAISTAIGAIGALLATALPAITSGIGGLVDKYLEYDQNIQLEGIKDNLSDIKELIDEILKCDDETLACILKSALNHDNETLAKIIKDKKLEGSDVNVTVTPSDNVSIAKVQYLSSSED